MTGDVLAARIRARVRDVPDFPQPGIVFKDITPFLGEPGLLGHAVAAIKTAVGGRRVDRVVAIESRGFIIGAPLAVALGCGFAPVRKIGKLPHTTTRVAYALEYGTGELEAHSDAVLPGERVLVVDDVLATGGTAAAAVELVGMLGAEPVGAAFLIELAFLRGRERLEDLPVTALVCYE